MCRRGQWAIVTSAPPDLPQVYPAARQTVYGEGPIPCDYLFLAQAPGYYENASGRTLIGPDGRFLNKLLEQFTLLRRSSVYLTNVVKHHPPGSRPPLVGETKAYRPYLWWEIGQVQPKVIITLGAVALREFDKALRVKTEHGRARLAAIDGVWEGVLVPWYMPSAAIRDASVVGLMIADAQRLAQEVADVRVEVAPADYWLGEDDDVAHMLLARWGEFGFDTETTSPVRAGVFATDEADMVGYSVSQASRTGVYVPTYLCGEGVASILGSPLWTKVCHNVKFEYKVLAKHGVVLDGYEDTKLAAYLLGYPNTGLKDLARQLLGEQPERIKDLWPEGIANQPKAVAAKRYADNFTYAAADADNTLRLWVEHLKQKLLTEDLWSVYEMEKAMVPVLAAMEACGMAVSEGQCRRTMADLRWHRVAAGQAAIGELIKAGIDIGRLNVRSPDQIAELLDGLGAPLRKRTKVKNRLVVDATALEGIRSWWPDFLGPLLDERKLGKLYGYVENFLALRGPDGRVHTSFNQAGHWEEADDDAGAGSRFGRLSSSGPNLQNIPHHRATVRGIDWAGAIRGCLRPTEGWLLMSVDLGQEEPRIIAVVAQDSTLLEGFANGRDIYRPATMALYSHTNWNDDIEDKYWAVEYDHERFFGKQFFLAWYYGAGAGRLKALDKTLTAGAISAGLRLLDEAHPARRLYLDGTWELLHEAGYIQSLYGRKRWLPKVWSVSKADREAALREAANGRIQMTAADILKLAMPRIADGMAEAGCEGRLVSTVHDEVVLELPVGEVAVVNGIVARAFDGLLPGLPLTVETKVGPDWGHMEGI